MSNELFGNPARSFPNNKQQSQMFANAIPNIQFGSGGQVQTWDQGGKLNTKFTPGPAEQALLDSALRSALNFGSSGDSTENAVFQRAMTLLQPQFDAEDVGLSNRGIPMGSEIWRKSQDQRGRVLGDTALGSVMAGNQERSRMLSEIMGILTGTPQMSMTPGPVYDPMQPAIAQMAGQQSQTGMMGDFVGGLFGLGGAMGGAALGNPAMFGGGMGGAR